MFGLVYDMYKNKNDRNVGMEIVVLGGNRPKESLSL